MRRPSGSGGVDDWKRFILVRAGAAPINLQPGRAFLVGRNQDTDLPIPSQRVSRRHSEIFWRRGRPWLRDCGSQNGTTVNGKRISGDHELRDGDEVGIGPFLCTYRYVTGGSSMGQVLSAPDSNALTQPMVGDAMAGNLEQMSLFELLQTLEFNQKTGTLTVFGSDGDGTLVVKEGAPIYAQCGRDKGEEAVITLLALQSGQFSFSPEVSEQSRNVNQSITGLLFEAGRRMDEQQQ